MRMPKHTVAFPALALERPFRLFGKDLEIRRSSHLTMLPDVVLWAAAGMSLEKLVETQSDEMAWVYRTLARAFDGKNRLSSTTLFLVRRGLESPLLAGVSVAPTQEELIAALSVDKRPWTSLAVTLPDAVGEDLHAIIQKLAAYESLPDRARALSADGREDDANALLLGALRQPEHFWSDKMIAAPAFLVIDVALSILADVDAGGRDGSDMSGAGTTSYLLDFLRSGKKPIGHWLLRQQRSAGCKSLAELSERVGIISLDRLKCWSSGRDLMTPDAASSLLKALEGHVDRGVEMRRYRNARLMSFMTEFVICTTRGNTPSWLRAQAIIEERYRELLELAVSRGGAVLSDV